MSKRRASTDSEEIMEEVRKLERRESGGEMTTKEYVLFSGDAVFVTEMNVVCLSGPVTGEERITVTVKRNFKLRNEKDMHYMIGKTVKLGFLIKDYCDRIGFTKSEFRFFAPKISKRIAENQTPEELGLRDGDVIVALLSLKA